MAVLNPQNTTMGDLVNEALKLSGRLGLGQTALAEDVTLGWTYLQWMLQQWARERFHVYRLVTLEFTSTGAISYTVGPAGDFNTGTVDNSVRPAKIASAFLRQENAGSTPIDFPIEILNSREDYNRIRVKELSTLSSVLFYDPAWPLGAVYFWPVPPATQYSLHLSVMLQLPPQFDDQNDVIDLPYEYYWAIVSNLAMRLRTRYGIKTFPGDTLPGQAKESMKALKDANSAIPRLAMPMDFNRSGSSYNIYSDSY